jgi:hypothetical protein
MPDELELLCGVADLPASTALDKQTALDAKVLALLSKFKMHGKSLSFYRQCATTIAGLFLICSEICLKGVLR